MLSAHISPSSRMSRVTASDHKIGVQVDLLRLNYSALNAFLFWSSRASVRADTGALKRHIILYGYASQCVCLRVYMYGVHVQLSYKAPPLYQRIYLN